MPSRRGVYNEMWDNCARCGRTRPLGELVKQEGFLVCTTTGQCLDDLSNQSRQRQIAECLSDGSEAVQEKVERAQEVGDLPNFI